MSRGPFRLIPCVFALLTLGFLAVYVFARDSPKVGVIAALIVVFGLLGLRASGLKLAEVEADPEGPTLKLKTEFEGPEDDES